MFKILGELKTLVIKGEDCLKEGQHLKETITALKKQKQNNNIEKKKRTTAPLLKHRRPCNRHFFIVSKRIRDNSVTHGLDAFKLLSLLDLLQFAHIIQWLLLEVHPHGFHLAVGLWRQRTDTWWEIGLSHLLIILSAENGSQILHHPFGLMTACTNR